MREKVYYNKAENNYFPDYRVLWSYTLSRLGSWLYQMKFAGFGILVFLGLMSLIPIFGLSNWNIMWLFGGCTFFTLVTAGIAFWRVGNIISYAITDKGIQSVKGLIFESTFDNIIRIKIKRNIFNKKKGSIKFKLKKGLSVNYNFDGIRNYEEAYNLLKERINSADPS